MKLTLIAMAAAGLLASGMVNAQDILKAKGCLGCHDMEKKKVGPSFKDSAAKYKDNAGAADAIVAKMKEGKGHPKQSASESDLKAAVTAALSAK